MTAKAGILGDVQPCPTVNIRTPLLSGGCCAVYRAVLCAVQQPLERGNLLWQTSMQPKV